MNRTLGAICALLLIVVAGLMVQTPTSATDAIASSFSDRYGPTLFNRYSCDLCHSGGVFSEFNPYGNDLGNVLAETGSCLDFYPPTTHTVSKGFCAYLHAPGLTAPFTNKCTTCHGATLEGLIAPSCYLCHDKRWDEAGPTPVAASAATPHISGLPDAFAAIEQLDSDGDGFSNIDEINAGSHPGDPGSYPGGIANMSVAMNTTWNRGWTDSGNPFAITLTPVGTTVIDTDFPVVLRNGARSITINRLALDGRNVIATVPQGLLYTLFNDMSAEKSSITVSATSGFEEQIVVTVDITFTGKTLNPIDGLSVIYDPNLWASGKDVTVFIRGDKKGLINEKKIITVLGLFSRARLTDVVRNGDKVTGTLKADDAEEIIGEAVDGQLYVISVFGATTDKDHFFAAFNQVRAEAGGGDNCFKFKPPSSHNVPKTDGTCTYDHAPGFDTPFASKCTSCHGSDLTGSSFAPSCFLCHGQLWSSAPPNSTEKR